MRFATLLFVPAVVLSSSAGSQQVTRLDTAAVTQWREDLAFLKAEAPRRHADLFHTMSRAQFDSALESISSRLPQLARHEVIVELQKTAAMIGDGHSNVGPWRDSLVAFRTLPVFLYWFDEGMMIRAADSAHASLVGAKIVELGGVPIDSAIARVKPLISADNVMGIRHFTPFYLMMPEVLHATRIVTDMERVPITVEKNGKRQTVTLSPAGRFPMLTGEPDRSWVAQPAWVDARGKTGAMWLSNPLDSYWYRSLPENRALYMQINTIQHKQSDSLGAFLRRALASGDSAGAERLILDLRLNGGGNGSLNRNIMLPIIKSRYDTAGKFYVLTSRRTWSAAQMLVTELEKYTNATFVGEPTASKANHYGDSYRIVLPNSRVTFRVSTLWHQYRDSRDKRPMIEPQVKAQLTFADYAAGRDPVLEAALKH